MDLLQLEGFVKVAKTQNISQSAKSLNITQPALSHRISLLENELGLTLFDRIAKSITLNQNGEALLPYAKQVLDDVYRLQKAAQNQLLSNPNAIILNICSASSTIMEAVSQFNREYPSIPVMLYYYGNSKELSADLCIDSDISPADSPYDLTILKEELKLAFPPHHPLYDENGVLLCSMSELPFLSGFPGSHLARDTFYFCGQAGFTPKIAGEINNNDHRMHMVSLGQGISFIPAVTQEQAKFDGIQVAKILDVDCYRYVNLHCCKRGQTSRQIMKLYHYIENFFKQKDSYKL